MAELASGGAADQRPNAWVVVAMLAMVVVPAALTLNSVRLPATLRMSSRLSEHLLVTENLPA
jgi:hypothetical protein